LPPRRKKELKKYLAFSFVMLKFHEQISLFSCMIRDLRPAPNEKVKKPTDTNKQKGKKRKEKNTQKQMSLHICTQNPMSVY